MGAGPVDWGVCELLGTGTVVSVIGKLVDVDGLGDGDAGRNVDAAGAVGADGRKSHPQGMFVPKQVHCPGTQKPVLPVCT